MKYCILTYGCQMNFHDSEKIDFLMIDRGYELVDSYEKADLIIINTCSIRETADDKVYGLLGQLKHYKKLHPKSIICVCGCMTQRIESRQLILDKFKNVDIIIGTNNIYMLPKLIDEHLINRNRIVNIVETTDFKDDEITANRLYKYKSFVNIMYGCNNYCTYCIVPFTRGREVSRDKSDILREVTGLVETGCKEITLLGQNVNSYGKSLQNGENFADLILELGRVKDLERVRFMTSHPKDISNELLDKYSGVKNLMPVLHLPVQSGSDRILKLMNRSYTVDKYIEKINYARKILPNIAITTDIIVGFPGETESDFEETINLVKKVGFDNAYTFLYSKRSGTKAAEMENQVPDDVKKERFNKLLKVLYEIFLEKNKVFIDKEVEVLFEEQSKTNDAVISGRARDGRLVHVESDISLIGQIRNVKITNVNTFSLFGIISEV